MKKFLFTTGFINVVLFLSVIAQQRTENTKMNAASGSKKSINPLTASIERGLVVFQKECLSCHQEDGSGVQRMFPPLIKTKVVLGKKSYLIQTVLNGSGGIIKNKDEIYHNVMASYNNLTDRQVADVLTYIRNSFGNKAVAVNAAEVKVVRVKLK